MALKILDSPSKPEDAGAMCAAIRSAIEKSIEGAAVSVTTTSPYHFEIQVVSGSFDGESPVRRQQRVYAAIAHLMKGDAAPVHAVDRMVTRSS